MFKSKYSLFLIILLTVIIVGIFAVALVDRIQHSNPSSSDLVVLTSDKAQTSKIGFRIGDEAPDFVLPTIDNHDVALSDYRGKNVILNFWATWCGPCRYETPFLSSIHNLYLKDDSIILAVSIKDTPENAAAYAKQNNLDFIIPVDSMGQMIDDYSVRGIPTTFFIDKQGIIKDIKIGPFVSEDELIDKIKSSFK